MSRNMKDANQSFFNHIINSIPAEYSDFNIPNWVRSIKANVIGKAWLKNAVITRSFKFSKNSFAVLIYFEEAEYICLINATQQLKQPVENFELIEINSGVFTLLGSEGFLKINAGIDSSEIIDKLLYDTSQLNGEYTGHELYDIEQYFYKLLLFKLNFNFPECYIKDNANLFYWVICNLLVQMRILSSNAYNAKTIEAWERIIFEQSELDRFNYKGLLLSYCALTWDITYLYLYQCLEDIFVKSAATSLYKKLKIEMPISNFSHLLYDELQWQPKDLDCIQSIVDKLDQTSEALVNIKLVSKDMDIAKWIYKMRNSIVHETRETLIAIDDDEQWNNAITGLIYLLIEATTTIN